MRDAMPVMLVICEIVHRKDIWLNVRPTPYVTIPVSLIVVAVQSMLSRLVVLQVPRNTIAPRPIGAELTIANSKEKSDEKC